MKLGLLKARAVARQFLPPVSITLAKRFLGTAGVRALNMQLQPYKRDQFLTRMSFVVPGMLAESNLSLFEYAIRHMPKSGAAVEIGSFAGLSLNHILHMMRLASRSNPVFSVDEWRFAWAEDEVRMSTGSEVSLDNYRNHVIDTFKRNLQLFHTNRLPHHVVSSSDVFFQAWEENETVKDFFGKSIVLGGPIALAYIDGDHSHEQSKRDFENVDRFLIPGGFVIFDDSDDYSEWGSRLTASEAAARPDYDLIGKNPNYCIRKRG